MGQRQALPEPCLSCSYPSELFGDFLQWSHICGNEMFLDEGLRFICDLFVNIRTNISKAARDYAGSVKWQL